jgi:energy-coupling factor transport system substrate-specific component
MWSHTKMIALVVLSAALYAAILIPFKGFQVMPGIDLRPSTVIPPVVGVLFGPAGAWGCAIGNLVADFFGTIGLGSIFGFIGNFLFSFAAYKLWYQLPFITRDNDPVINSPAKFAKWVVVCIGGAAALTSSLDWGLSGVLSLLPYPVLSTIVFPNNLVAALILGAPLLALVYRRLKRWGLIFTDIMSPDEVSQPGNTILGNICVWVGLAGSIALSYLLGLAFNMAVGLTLAIVTLPLVALWIIGLAILGVPREQFEEEALPARATVATAPGAITR